MSSTTHDAIALIAAAPAHTRARLVNDFIADRMGSFRRIASALCRNFGVAPGQYLEDFSQMVCVEAYTMLTEQLEETGTGSEIMNFEGLLHHRARQVVRTYLDTDDAPATEMTSIMRRKRVLKATRDEMAQNLGRVPTDREVVDEHNDRMHRQRANPAKQGVLASVNDFQTFRTTAEIGDHDFSQPIDMDCVLHPVEGPQVVKMIVERTRQYSEQLGWCAELWLAGVYDRGEDDAPRYNDSPKEIAETMGVTAATVRNYIRKIKEHAMVIVAEEFGITEDTV
ncbi:hypothetical protein V6N00_13860 [Tersicoccus sp. MR15.9]|uniref:hypothetical protein n=1 Tax=Tersicoccus mangrovi TaxID=3121635 RepID=UPI002FE65D26